MRETRVVMLLLLLLLSLLLFCIHLPFTRVRDTISSYPQRLNPSSPPRLHASGLHKSRRSYCTLTFPISSFYTFTSIQPEAQVYNQPLQDMSNSKPYVTSSGTLGAQPLAHRISIKISDFATLAYLFFETLVSVSRAKRQIHIFYLSRIHM